MRRAGLLTTAVAATAAFPAAAMAAPPVLEQADAPPAQLERTDTTALGDVATVRRFEQEVGGIPVVGADAVVVDVAGERPELLFDNSIRDVPPPSDPAIDRGQAIGAALAAIGDPRGGRTEARLVILGERSNRLAWEVTHSDVRPIMDWRITVDAADGSIVEQADLVRRGTQMGEAMLFVPNPVVRMGGYTGLRDRRDRDSANLTAAREAVDLEKIKAAQTCLKGPYAMAKLGPKRKPVCKRSLRWNNVTRKRGKFEALMAFFHATTVQQYIRTLGLAPINRRSQVIVANPISQDNSFYLPSRDEIQLGTGGVDDGEDADVIVHEYGHAVQDDQAPQAFSGWGNDAGAMGEGFGDYLAAIHSTELVGFDDEWTPCIMEWDAISYDDNFEEGTCLRRADIEDTLPERKIVCGGSGEIHCVGQVWSSALLDLRDALGDDGDGDSMMDTIVLSSHFLLDSSPTFPEASQRLIDADQVLYGGANCVAIAAELEDRQLRENASTLC